MTTSSERQGCLSVFLSFLPRKRKSAAKRLPYRLRDDFLSPAELSFYKVLSAVLGERYILQSKVRLTDIFFVLHPQENVAYWNRISQRHVDFLVCDAETMKPLFGVELDDASHRKPSRQEHDRFLDEVFRTAQLPLLRFQVQRAYRAQDIEARVAPLLKAQAAVPKRPAAGAQAAPMVNSAAPLCPKCGVPMVLRTVRRGPHQGKQFYGCVNFPHCREVKPLPKKRASRSSA